MEGLAEGLEHLAHRDVLGRTSQTVPTFAALRRADEAAAPQLMKDLLDERTGQRVPLSNLGSRDRPAPLGARELQRRDQPVARPLRQLHGVDELRPASASAA